MTYYQNPTKNSRLIANPNEIFILASGDLRLSANQTCWPAQLEMEQKITGGIGR